MEIWVLLGKYFIGFPNGPKLFGLFEQFKRFSSDLDAAHTLLGVQFEQKRQIGKGIKAIELFEPFYIGYAVGAEGDGREKITAGHYGFTLLLGR